MTLENSGKLSIPLLGERSLQGQGESFDRFRIPMEGKIETAI